MSAFMAIYWLPCIIALASLAILGLSRRATRAEGVRLAVIVFGIGAFCMAAAIAYNRYLVYGVHFAGPPSAMPGRAVLAWVVLVAASAAFVPMGASVVCLWNKMWTGSLAFASSAAFMSCVSSELGLLGDNGPMWRGLLVAEIIGSAVAALLACIMAVWHRR